MALLRLRARLINVAVTMTLASKLMDGKPYSVTSDNPEAITRCRSLAKHLGASVESIEESEAGTTTIIFRPASRQ
jgi:hypothetical protein